MRTSFNADWVVKPKLNRFLELTGSHSSTPPETVTLPHDAMIGTTRDPSGSHMNAYFPGGVWEYNKTFDAPQQWRDRRVRLQFEGVYRDAVVYVNDDFAGSEPNGYGEFVIDLDPFVRYGAPNTVKVECRASDDSRWYSGAGIHRPVHLWVQERTHLAIDGVWITTPEIDDHGAVVEIAAEIENETPHTITVTVTNTIRDAAGAEVVTDAVPVSLRPHTSAIARQRLFIANPARWSTDTPNLYKCTTTVTRQPVAFVPGTNATGSVELDQTVTTFGVRSLQLDSRHGLRINGETVKLRGACVHHDNGPIGAATIDRAEHRRVEVLRAAGFNAIRSAHNPISRAMLEACDRLGVVVMDELGDVWTEGKRDHDHSLRFPDRWRIDAAALVRKDRNHPSVLMYSTGNEIPEIGSPLGAALARDIAEHVRALDPTRYVTNAVQPFLAIRDLFSRISEFLPPPDETEGAPDQPTGVNSQMTTWAQIKDRMMSSPVVDACIDEVCASLDVAGYNYLDVRYTADHDLHPDRVIVGSETYPTAIAHAWPLILDSGHVIGDFTWTGWDYLGEVGIGRTEYAGERTLDDGSPQFMAPYPWLTAHAGDIDVTGRRRPQSYFREIVFGLRSEPYIAVRRPGDLGKEVVHSGPWSWSDTVASWTWPGSEDVPVPIEVYSDADEVELFHNGESVDRRPAGPANGYRADFEVAYAPGELVAVAYSGGAETGRSTLRTASDERRLTAEVDRDEIDADDTDLAYVTVHIADPAGAVDPGGDGDRAVTVTVEGPAVVQGFASADPRSLESYRSPVTTTFEGTALAVIRPTGPGTIQLTFTAEGLDPANCVVTARLDDPTAAR